MSKKSKKEQIVETVLSQLPEHLNEYKEIPTSDVVFRWFLTGRASDGLRLSDEGKRNFLMAEIAHYDFPLSMDAKKAIIHSSSFTINLSKKLKCPFYLGADQTSKPKIVFIRVYDHRIAMMISLFGSIQEYLDSMGV